MVTPELQKEMEMPYDELCEYLKRKYGSAICDYFSTPECKSRNPKIGRGNEGLYCHHIDEDKGGNLSGLAFASRQPFSWQKSDRLVYCNLIEHLLLHIKIAVMRQKDKITIPSQISSFFSTGGIIEICKDINSLYQNEGGTKKYQKISYEVIKDNLIDYVFLINAMLKYIDSIYIGDRLPSCLRKGGIIVFYPNEKNTILEIDSELYNVKLRAQDGTTHDSPLYVLAASDLLPYEDTITFYISWISSTNSSKLYRPVFDTILEHKTDSCINDLCKLLYIDFHGYGFPQFSNDFLNKNTYGAKSIDEYISKAFPAKVPLSYKIGEEKPDFWEGEIPKKFLRKFIKNNCFFIVRFSASFSIFPNHQPFVYNRNVWKSKIDEDNNFLRRTGQLVESCENPVILTLTKEDFFLFNKCYNIKSITILDGCYWK